MDVVTRARLPRMPPCREARCASEGMPGCHQAGGLPDRSRQPGLPFRWFSGRMHDAVDSHRSIRDFIEHSVWKPSYQRPSVLAMHPPVKIRCATDALQTCENAVKKLAPQPASLLVIPAEARGDVRRCFWCEAYFNRHGASSAVGPSSHPMIAPIAAVPRGFRDAVRFLRVARGVRAHRPADSRHRPRDPRPTGVSRQRSA